MAYDYYQMRLGRGRTSQATFAQQLYLNTSVVAVFAPVLGFASDQALVLTRSPIDMGTEAELTDRLSPTLRPLDDPEPTSGGIYVHNWFTIDGDAVEEFVRLSGEAWLDFEARFDARIFGLFLADESPADHAEGARRLLLMTRYRDLGEWQMSRDPTSAAMKIFARRRELTRVSLARACQLISRTP